MAVLLLLDLFSDWHREATGFFAKRPGVRQSLPLWLRQAKKLLSQDRLVLVRHAFPNPQKAGAVQGLAVLRRLSGSSTVFNFRDFWRPISSWRLKRLK